MPRAETRHMVSCGALVQIKPGSSGRPELTPSSSLSSSVARARVDHNKTAWEQLFFSVVEAGSRASARDASARTFFMMPALRLEKVMWRLDLSLINLISIFRRSRPPFSSSSSSSSAAGRCRLTPRFSLFALLPLPTECASSRSVGDVWSCWSVMSAIVREGNRGCNCDGDYKTANANPNPNPIVVDLYHTALEKATSGGDTALSVVPMDLYWIWRVFSAWAERDRR